MKTCVADGCNRSFSVAFPVTTKIYCSSSCGKRQQRANNPLVKTCERKQCSKPFNAYDKRAKFCSHSCAASVGNIGVKRSKKPVRKCTHCSIDTTNEKYCSTECVSLARHLVHNTNGLVDASKISGDTCALVGCETPSGRNKFCSNDCIGKSRRSFLKEPERWLGWLNGEVSMSTPRGTLRTPAREFLYEEAEWKCTECSWGEPNPVLGRPFLAVDHIDGDWRNNFISNLKVLCFNCHTLTPTFGSLNIG